MNIITITDKSVFVEVTGVDKFFSFKGKFTIPREVMRNVSVRTDDIKPPWIKIMGTSIPKLITAGTYYGASGKEFWNIHLDNESIVFDLENYEYSRIVVQVDNAAQIISQLSK